MGAAIVTNHSSAHAPQIAAPILKAPPATDSVVLGLAALVCSGGASNAFGAQQRHGGHRALGEENGEEVVAKRAMAAGLKRGRDRIAAPLPSRILANLVGFWNERMGEPKQTAKQWAAFTLGLCRAASACIHLSLRER